jgi:hypothetical protein
MKTSVQRFVGKVQNGNVGLSRLQIMTITLLKDISRRPNGTVVLPHCAVVNTRTAGTGTAQMH